MRVKGAGKTIVLKVTIKLTSNFYEVDTTDSEAVWQCLADAALGDGCDIDALEVVL